MDEVPLKDQILKYQTGDGYEFVVGTGESSFRKGWTIILNSSGTRREVALGLLSPADILEVIGLANHAVEKAVTRAASARYWDD